MSDGELDPAAGQLLLVALVQEYAEHHRVAREHRRDRRGLGITALVFAGVAAASLLVCGTLLVIDLIVGLNPAAPAGSAASGLTAGAVLPAAGAGFMGLVFLMARADLRRKIEAAEAGMADVLARLCAAFPQLEASRRESLLSGALVNGITARRPE
jgi:hypothetical protein